MELIRELPALGRDLGPGLILIGLTSIAAIIVGCLFKEWEALPWMAAATVSLCGIGLLLRFLPKTSKVPRTSTSIAATALVWVIVGICGSFPFLFTGMPFLDAAFESMSAWTGTGFSIAENIEAWPKTLLFWRSFMHEDITKGTGLSYLAVSRSIVGRADQPGTPLISVPGVSQTHVSKKEHTEIDEHYGVPTEFHTVSRKQIFWEPVVYQSYTCMDVFSMDRERLKYWMEREDEL